MLPETFGATLGGGFVEPVVDATGALAVLADAVDGLAGFSATGAAEGSADGSAVGAAEASVLGSALG
ncbi:MAG: hypothetical protein HUU21_12555, partial [Polyangiaceae bacterium]|nr:hypothetical protein [Polyangiaceae bacterium]